MSREEVLQDRLDYMTEMVRIFTVSLHAVHEKDHLNGGARMMLTSMGRATLSKADEWKED